LAFNDWGNNKSVAILDGATGRALGRVALAREYSSTPCGFSEYEPKTLGPIVGSDGDAYLLVHKSVTEATGTCNNQVTVLHEEGWTLLHLARTGQVGSVVVDQSGSLTPAQFLPDGVGGLLIRGTVWLGGNQYESRLIRFDAEWQRTEHVIGGSRIDLVGQAGIVYFQTRTSNDEFYGFTQAFNVITGTSLWTKSPGWNLIAAKPGGGGTALDSAGQLLDIDSTGELASTTPFGFARPILLPGSVIGQGTTTGELKAVTFDSPDATRFCATVTRVGFGIYEPSCFGNLQGNLSLPGYFSNYNAIDLNTTESPGFVFDTISLSVHRHLVWERVGGDQLVWSSDEALYFATYHSEGWSGNLLELGWEYVRGYFRQSGTLTDRKTSLVVIRITNNGTTQTVVPDTATFPLGVFENRVYAVHNGTLSKWVDGTFVSVGEGEASRVHHGMAGGQFSNVNGWSSVVNVVKREPGQHTYPLSLLGVPVNVIADQGPTFQRVSVQYADKPPTTILEFHTGAIPYDQTAYSKLFSVGASVLPQ